MWREIYDSNSQKKPPKKQERGKWSITMVKM